MEKVHQDKAKYSEPVNTLNPFKKRAIIVDVDGTICLHGERGPFEWEKISTDSPNLPIVKVVKSLIQFGYVPVYVSGREEFLREETEKWLLKYLGECDHLFLRPNGDYRSDIALKKELYRTRIQDHFEVLLVLDDRNKIVDMWRNDLGLTCLQVSNGDF